MAAKTEVIIHDVNVHPSTGHVSYVLKTRTTDGNASWEGPKATYGVDAQTLRDRFNGDIAQFEVWAANEHKSLTGPHPDVLEAVMKRKGQVIG
jgi:hypothetical protein